MNIKLFTNIIKQFRDSKIRLIFEKSIFYLFYGFTKVGQYRGSNPRRSSIGHTLYRCAMDAWNQSKLIC